MGGAETTGAPFRRPLPDARREPPGVAVGSQSSRSGDSGGGRGRYIGSRGEGERDRGNDGRRGEERETNKWEMLVMLVQLEYRDGVLAEEAAWQEVVLIPKGGGD